MSEKLKEILTGLPGNEKLKAILAELPGKAKGPSLFDPRLEIELYPPSNLVDEQERYTRNAESLSKTFFTAKCEISQRLEYTEAVQVQNAMHEVYGDLGWEFWIVAQDPYWKVMGRHNPTVALTLRNRVRALCWPTWKKNSDE